MADHSTLLPICHPIAHFLEFFCLHGAPANTDAERPVTIIVNHGYAVGFSPKRLQPVWAAYQVSAATRDVDYERPEVFYDDPRLPLEQRIGTSGFRPVRLSKDGVEVEQKYDRGHMVPNFAINKQFGRIAQAETFFMSNIIPQQSTTNRNAWQKLEKAIISAYAPMRKQVWAMVGPIFGAAPIMMKRKNNLEVPVPEAYFLVLADPERYPFDDPDNLSILALRVPQDWGNKEISDQLTTSLDEIESATGLKFFPRLSDSEKSKLKNQTSRTIWPFEKITAKKNDVAARDRTENPKARPRTSRSKRKPT